MPSSDQDYDPEDIRDYSRLETAVKASIQRKVKREEQRMMMLKAMVGPYYGEDGSKDRRPINMVELISGIFAQNLASHRPQAMVTTDYEELQPTGADFAIVLNRTIDKINLQNALNICAMEAMVTMGVMCVGISTQGDYDPGRVFAEPVLFPDLILDTNAKSWDQQCFVGHDFLVPREWVTDNSLFDKSTGEKLLRSRQHQMNGRDWEILRNEEYQDMIRLRQLFLPHRNRIILCDPEGGGKLPLLSREWDGPDEPCGPYLQLSFRVVPGNLFPLAPMPLWYDLDYVINKSFNKAARQSLRSKKVGLTRNNDDAETIKALEDGDIGGVADPDSVVERIFGGADQQLIGMATFSRDLLNYVAGNPEIIGGLGAQSGTVGQDQLLSQGASGKMKEMQQSMIGFETKVINSIAFWKWQDPLSEERFTKRLEGTQYSLPGTWSPETRQGEFFQYNFECNPYKLPNRSPTERGQALIEMFERIVMPAIPYMQQGSPVDWEQFIKLVAERFDLPELNHIINWPQGESMPSAGAETPKPSSTTRRYVRENKPSASRSGKDKALMAMAFGSDVQSSEKEALAR